ncbi:uncharacterized protein LOC118280715 [Spodoptera frugiperda]|uniref:Uncharacterized protein LOC118280715 n=1 Tax=Spodoptera frugiperda TaxID=7108 RepID=A0A9R0DJL4_SPOFR|nr:uncharacterized protein LOC118280715 [Spodoptera frugiperda]
MRHRPVHATMFNDNHDIRLIRLVKQNPVLYDINHEKYMEFNSREVAWQKIGDALKKPAADCKLRWVNIRDVHRRILRKNLMDPSNPSKSYKYENELTFMKPFYKDINFVPTGQDDEEEEDRATNSWIDPPEEERQHSDEDSDVPKKKAKTRKKRSRRKQEPHFEEVTHTVPMFNESVTTELDASDSVDAFLLSIGATLKTFSPYHLNLAKSKIFAVVQDHDLQQIVERQKPSSEGSESKIAPSQSFYSG